MSFKKELQECWKYVLKMARNKNSFDIGCTSFLTHSPASHVQHFIELITALVLILANIKAVLHNKRLKWFRKLSDWFPSASSLKAPTQTSITLPTLTIKLIPFPHRPGVNHLQPVRTLKEHGQTPAQQLFFQQLSLNVDVTNEWSVVRT